jgi:hypothetical protein
VIERDVSELRAAGHIADRKGAAVRRAQPRIDGDPLCRRLDPGDGQVERLDARAAPRRDQQVRSRNPLAVA